MPWPLPPAWRERAYRAILGHPPSPATLVPPPIDPDGGDGPSAERVAIATYIDVRFRARFFEVVGHEYLMAFHHRYVGNNPPRVISPQRWLLALGVNRTTVHRWRRREVMGGAEKFLASQMFVLKTPLIQLELPADTALLRECVLTMVGDLARVEGGPPPTRLLPAVFRRITFLMSAMTARPDLVYPPPVQAETDTPSPEAVHRAVTGLVDQLNAAEVNSGRRNGTAVLPSEVRVWLDTWGLAYALFAVGYRESWAKSADVIKVFSHAQS
jgi:hypothetical protein